MLDLIRSNRNIRNKIESLRDSITCSKVFNPSNVSRFVFLCGANKNKTTISERRKALLKFSKAHLPQSQFFLAEEMFTTLQTEGHRGNLLDIEQEISTFADQIILVLESPSTFAELGAFSHNKLRGKLIVINDSEFAKSESFINMGPLKAIKEASSEKNIIHYKMSEDGIQSLDSIGDVFDEIYELLKAPLNSRSSVLTLDDCSPASNFNKTSAMFVHDLVYFTGPINHKELVEVSKLIFGEANFKLKEHVAILSAFESIERNDVGLYRSKMEKPFYVYKYDINRLISTFRNYLLKSFPERMYEY